MPPKKLCLIDALNQIHRAYHALPELTNSRGVPTNATLGFVTMLRKLINEEKPDYCGVVFDPPGPTVRHEDYAGYKSSRPETPDNLRKQIPWIRRIVEAMGIPIFELPRYEADDVIGTLAARAEEAGIRTVIVSEDKDLLQLVSDKVKLLTERNQRYVYGPEEVENKYGVPPRLMTDLLGLMGDSVDDIPGVPGIGPKRARELLQTYGSLENAVDHAGDLAKYKYGRNLAEYAEQADLSKRLATIHRDLPIDLPLEAMGVGEPDVSTCRKIFTELEFRRLLDDYVQEPERAEGQYRTIANSAELEEAITTIREAGRVAIKLQVDARQPMRAQIVGVGLSWEPGSGVYVPLAHQGLGATNAMRTNECLRLLSPLLGDGAVDIVGYDLKRDLITLARHGVVGVQPQLDIMLASYVLHPTRQSHGLSALASDLLHVCATELKEIIPDRKATFDAIPVAEATRYATERADLTLRLAIVFDSELEAQPDLGALLADLEMPLMQVLAAMELCGIRIDTGYLAEMSSQFAERIKTLQTEICEIAGEPFNLNSPKQLAEILFDRTTRRRQDRQGQSLHQGRDTRSAGPRLPDRQPDSGVSRTLEAQEHVRRRTAGLRAARYRPRSRILRSGGGCDRTPVEQQPEPAEHSHPQVDRTADSPRFYSRRWVPADDGRLLADRAAHYGASIGRPGAAAGFPRRHRHPPCHRRADFPCRTSRR